MNSNDRREITGHGGFFLLYAGPTVIWFFDKDGQKLRYEINRDQAAGCYRLVVTHPDGKESIEELAEPAKLIERSVELMNTLRGSGWHVA